LSQILSKTIWVVYLSEPNYMKFNKIFLFHIAYVLRLSKKGGVLFIL